MQAKKILIGLDSSPQTTSVVDFALNFFNRAQSIIVGIVLNEADSKAGQYVNEFMDRSKVATARYLLESDADHVREQLEREGKFADLAVISADTWIRLRSDNGPQLTDTIWGNLRCPIVVIPPDFQEVKNIILTYDGQHNSFFAIKQFCYLFATMCKGAEVTLLTVIDEESEYDLDPAEEKLLIEYLKQHCTNLGFYKVIGEPREIIHNHIGYSPDSLVVLGGTHESEMAELFHKPLAGGLPQSTSAPAFIARSLL